MRKIRLPNLDFHKGIRDPKRERRFRACKSCQGLTRTLDTIPEDGQALCLYCTLAFASHMLDTKKREIARRFGELLASISTANLHKPPRTLHEWTLGMRLYRHSETSRQAVLIEVSSMAVLMYTASVSSLGGLHRYRLYSWESFLSPCPKIVFLLFRSTYRLS